METCYSSQQTKITPECGYVSIVLFTLISLWKKALRSTTEIFLRLLYAGGVTHLRVGDSFIAIRDIYYVESVDGEMKFTLQSGLSVSINNEHQRDAIEGFRMLRDLRGAR